MTLATKWAWGLWGAFVLALIGATYAGMNPPSGKPIALVDAIWAASFVGFPTAGAIVVARVPRRPLGWMLLGAPLLLEVGLLVDELGRNWVDHRSGAAAWMVWFGTVSFGIGLAVLVSIPLYLPNGELPSPRWRWVRRAVWGFIALMGLQPALQPGSFEGRAGRRLTNPIGLESFEGALATLSAVLEPATLAVVAAGVTSLIVRFRASRGVERQQLKWLALGGTTLLTSIALLMLVQAVGVGVGEVGMTLVFVVAILCLPVSIAIAVMKTRLYDVDLVINKTLVYGALTALLALSYLAIVVVLQSIFGDLVRGSDLVVAGSTLAVAALFRPMRGRVQGFIDRRFYRNRYDAAETLETFSARLREQVDLDSLRDDIVEVVQDTMQPAHATLWLRGAAE